MEDEYEIWDIERRSGLYARAHERGRSEGLEQGLEQGRRTTLVELITTVLELRSIPVDSVAREQLRNCTDVVALERWAVRAREVASASDLFDD